jgi:hypothetical protein
MSGSNFGGVAAVIAAWSLCAESGLTRLRSSIAPMTYEEQRTRYQGWRRRRTSWHFWIAPLAWAVISFTLSVQLASAVEPTGKAWIEQSNRYTRQLFDVQLQHSPEQGSREGLARFDAQISDPRLADELVQRRELEAVLSTLKTARTQVADKDVQEDLDINLRRCSPGCCGTHAPFWIPSSKVPRSAQLRHLTSSHGTLF